MSLKPKIRLSLVIPCWNEAANLPLLARRCVEALTRHDIEVILVDNGSTDETPAVMERLLAAHAFLRSVRVEVNQGYGFGILSGLRAARGEILAWTHADLQTDPADALRGLAFFDSAENPELVFVKGRRHGRPVADVVFTAGMSIFETLLLRRFLHDINAQPTMFPKRFFEEWSSPPHDFSLDLYALYLARMNGLRVHRFPVHFGARAHGVSRWNVNWRAKMKFIRRTLAYSFSLRRSLERVR